jgi:CBS domain containing-hemolysin-like protein
VLGNTFASAAMLAVALWMAIHGRWPLAPTVVGLLALILIGCEVWPKALAVRRPEQWALRAAGPMAWVLRFSLPLCRVAQRLNAVILRAVARRTVQAGSALTDAD